jgi:translation initiation factor IF-2
MSYETIRISELAKELALSSKEVIEKFAQLGITGKTHSSTVTVDQISRLKEFIENGGVKKVTKPKAFVVKKAKVEPPPEEIKEEKKDDKKSAEKAEKPAKIERPKVEIVKPVSRLEIVRKAPPKTDVTPKPADKKFPPRAEKTAEEKKFTKQDKPSRDNKDRDFSSKKPIERRIIPQEIYDNKPGGGNSKRRGDNHKKNKDFNSKKEEQERISLEKAAAQHHKKKTQKTEEVEEVKQIVVTQAMTISELSDKIKKTPAEIVKFLMLNGVMATVNQLIDVDVIKKVCAEYGL